jgi:hypothetical protein
MVFPTLVDVPGQLMQLAEIQFFDNSVAADADFDGDSDVDGHDFLIWQRGLGLTGQTNNDNGDANSSGVVDGADLTVWKAAFGVSATVAAGSIPEPAAGVLALLASLAVAASRRSREVA